MGIDLNKLKDLRERGATVQMQEDLASFLGNDGGYDSEAFLPTIDFILMLQNKAQSQSVEQENTLDLSDFDIPQVYDPTYFDKISIKAAAELVKSAALEDQLKLELLAYLDSMDIQRNVGKSDQEPAHSRANISGARKRDRNKRGVKSVFESIVSGLNSLQVRLSQQNSNKKQQDKSMQQGRIRDIIAQKLQRDNIELKDDSQQEDKTSKKERKFLKNLRKAFIAGKKSDNENAGNDSQQNRSGGNDKERFQEKKAVSDVAHKYEQAQEQASKSAGDYKKKESSKEEKKDAQITASKTIGETKQVEAETKAKPTKEENKNQSSVQSNSKRTLRNSNLQSRLQTARARVQKQRDSALHTHEHDHTKTSKIDDKSAAKAVKQLKNLGVSLSEAEVAKVSNKELSNVAKLQDKQRG